MNEMQVLRRLRDDVPASLPVTHAETALLAAIRAEAAAPSAQAGNSVPVRRPAGARPGKFRLKLALAGGLSLALAAAITAAVVIPGSASAPGPGPGPGPSASLAVRTLAYHAAKAASAQPKVPAHHWVYWREQNGSGAKAHVWRVWTTADGQRSAYRYHGKVHIIQKGVQGVKFFRDGQYIGQPIISIVPPPYGGVSVGALFGKIPVRYADLRKLPSDPRALVDYLGHLPMPGWGNPDARAFEVIVELIQTYVMPPKLTAELYLALAHIPGVTVDKHAVDVAGRHGIGFVYGKAKGDRQELVLNRHSYRLMAVQLIRSEGGADGHVVFDGGTAILRMALVKGPGVLP
jgi:hypothetical protein